MAHHNPQLTGATATLRTGDTVAAVSVCQMRREDLHATLEAVAQRRCIAVQEPGAKLIVGRARSPYEPGGLLTRDL